MSFGLEPNVPLFDIMLLLLLLLANLYTYSIGRISLNKRNLLFSRSQLNLLCMFVYADLDFEPCKFNSYPLKRFKCVGIILCLIQFFRNMIRCFIFTILL